MAVIKQGLLRPGTRLISRWWKRVGVWIPVGIALYTVLIWAINDYPIYAYRLPWLMDRILEIGGNLDPLLMLCWLVPSSIALNSYENLRNLNAVPTGADGYTARLRIIIHSTGWSFIATVLLIAIFNFVKVKQFFLPDWIEITGALGEQLVFSVIGVALYGMWHVMLLVLLPKRQYLVWGLVGAGLAAPYVRYLPGSFPRMCGTGLPPPDVFDNYIWLLGLVVLLGMLVSYRLGHLLFGHVLYALVVLAIIRPVLPYLPFDSLGYYLADKTGTFLRSIHELMAWGFPISAILYNSEEQFWPSPIMYALIKLVNIAALIGLVYLLVFFLPRRFSRSKE